MATLTADIAAYDAMRAELESRHLGKWVVFRDGALVQVFDDFDLAAAEAVAKFGRGPYLIRQIGAPPVTLPASVMYHPMHEIDPLRV